MDIKSFSINKFHRKINKSVERRIGPATLDWSSIDPSLEVTSVDAKTLLQKPGKFAIYYYFLVSGLTRSYYTTTEGKELNKSFHTENDFVADLSAIYLEVPSRISIETIEPTILVQIPVKKFQHVFQVSPEMQFLYKEVNQREMVRNDRREEEFLTMSAQQRFSRFFRNRPDLAQRVPQYHIASYLGITPEVLSKHKKDWISEIQPARDFII